MSSHAFSVMPPRSALLRLTPFVLAMGALLLPAFATSAFAQTLGGSNSGGLAIPSFNVTFTAPTGSNGQGGTFSNHKTGAHAVTATARRASATSNATNVDKSLTAFASLTATAATIDVFGFGFTAPSGTLTFTDVTTGSPVASPVTLNTAAATTVLTPQVTTSTGTNTFPCWTELADVNGDGKLDLITSLYETDSVSVQLGNGDGTFQAATNILIASGFGPAEVHAVSLRGGNIMDLIVGSFNANQIAVLLGDGNGTFQTPVFYTVGSAANTPTSLTTGDFNDDGNLDVATANTGDNTVSILLGDSSGGLTVSGSAINVGRVPEAIRAGDFNGDGFSDLAVANYADGTVSLLKNNDDGTFKVTVKAVGSGPQALGIVEVGTDLLIAVANFGSNSVTVLDDVGNSAKFAVTASVNVGAGPDDVRFADFNGDGIEDIVATNYRSGTVNLLMGSSGGTYTVLGPFSVGSGPYSAAVGDINLDGTPDLVVSNCFSNNTGVLFDGTQIATSYSGLSLTAGHQVEASYTPNGVSLYGTSSSAVATVP